MKKVIIIVEETEEEPGTVQSSDEKIEINFEGTVCPLELDRWIQDHIGHRPDDR